jgi:type IV secretion system protein VirB1
MTIHVLALAALIRHCAPAVAPSTMAAIVQVESGGDPFAIGDNTTRRSYYPHDRATAELLARRLLDAGHLLDLGIAQIDSMNFPGFGVNVHTIFDSCSNLSIAARILSGDYALAARRYGSGQVALRHAIGMYNTGRLNAGQSYVRRVLVAAGIQERHWMRRPIVVPSDAGQSGLLVRLPITDKKPLSTRHRAMAPSRAPILITVTRAPGVTLF